MAEKLFPYQSRDGVRRTMILDDEAPERVVVKTQQVLDEVLDGIARDRETMRHGTNKLAARLPVTVVENLIERGIYYDQDAFRKWLNGPEATPWRVWQGNV